jgi:hypothetical protein
MTAIELAAVNLSRIGFCPGHFHFVTILPEYKLVDTSGCLLRDRC